MNRNRTQTGRREPRVQMGRNFINMQLACMDNSVIHSRMCISPHISSYRNMRDRRKERCAQKDDGGRQILSRGNRILVSLCGALTQPVEICAEMFERLRVNRPRREACSKPGVTLPVEPHDCMMQDAVIAETGCGRHLDHQPNRHVLNIQPIMPAYAVIFL